MQKKFTQLIKDNKLNHAHIFYGDVDGALKFAQGLCGYLENGNWQAQPKSDFRFVECTQKSIGVDESRLLSHFLSLTPSVSQKRSAVVFGAHSLTAQAQNALLKIAEEPPKNALLILILSDPNALLPTLRSRFQLHFFNPHSIVAVEAVEDIKKVAKQILTQTGKVRSETIKDFIKNELPWESLIKELITQLGENKEKNYTALKELLHRWELMNQFNTNRRLQLEAALESVK